MISGTLWSIRSTPAPNSSRTRATTAAKAGISASCRPAAGSSISTNRGCSASARATPSLRSSPWGSTDAGSLGPRPRGRAAPSSSPARRPRLAPAMLRTPSAATSTFSRTVSAAEEMPVLERPREPGAAATVGRPARDRRGPRARRVPPVGRSKPGEHVHERRLAGAVRPDQPEDLVPLELEARRPRGRARRRRRARRRSPGAIRADRRCALATASNSRPLVDVGDDLGAATRPRAFPRCC